MWIVYSLKRFFPLYNNPQFYGVGKDSLRFPVEQQNPEIDCDSPPEDWLRTID